MHHSRGVLHLMRDLIDHANRNRGTLPKRRLIRYTTDEVEEIRVALPRSYWTPKGEDQITVNIERFQTDYGDTTEEVLAVWSRITGIPIEDKRGKRDATKEELRSKIEFWNLSAEATHDLLQLAMANTGWAAISLRKDGIDTTSKRIRAYHDFFHHLSSAQGDSLRAYLADRLSDSHILDDDAILRRAIENQVKQLSQEDDLDAAYGSLGILRRVGYPVAIWQGEIQFTTPMGDIQPDAWKISLPDSLPELTLRQTRINKSPEQALFVENPSAWERLRLLKFPALLVLTDGFPNHATHILAEQLHKSGTQCLFWGDIDAGGFRILNVLQRSAPMAPILMDRKTVNEHEDKLVSLTDEKRSTFDASHPVQNRCLELGGFLEQERIQTAEVIEAMLKERVIGRSG